jgi:prolipoprotein diacylglyceryltransferase
MVLAVVRLDFDPWVQIFGASFRLETLALAGVILLILVLAALSAGRARPAGGDSGALPEDRLRRDDLILIAFGAVPGAVVGGRLGYGLVHADYYSADPLALFDPGKGGLTLTLAVLLGTLTALAVARLLAAPIDRWLGVAAVPVLLGLGLGKLAMALGGTGQGAYSSAFWATSYEHTATGTSGATSAPLPDLWGSANPGYAALPSQLVEGGLVLLVVAAMFIAPTLLRLRVRRAGRFARLGLAPRREWAFEIGGRRFLAALGLWALVRLFAASTWRDARVLGPFVAEQYVLLVAIAVLAALALGLPASPGLLRRLGAAWAARLAALRAARAARREG